MRWFFFGLGIALGLGGCRDGAISIPCASDSHCPHPLVCRDRVCSTPAFEYDEALCAEQPTAQGCPCGSSDPVPCYEGDEVVRGAGLCVEGTRACASSRWGECENAVYPRDELCDARDNDCDGTVDEGAVNRCGTCNPCDRVNVGQDDLDPDQDGDGVTRDEDGALTLSSETVSAPFLWVANDDEQTVSKLRIADGIEVGRYASGPPQAVSNRPSRTSVDLLGDAYVVNRAFGAQGSIVKFAASTDRCVDRDGNGVITTSRDADGSGSIGQGEVLPWGRDECAVWTAEIGPFDAWPRAIAIGPGDEVSPQGYVWVGTFYQGRAAGTGRVYKIDAANGSLAAAPIVLPPDFHPYGAAVDCRGILWLQNGTTGELAGIDTETNALLAGAGASDGRITRPAGPDGCRAGYGMTVDGQGRVWSAGNRCEDAWRYTPERDDPTLGNWERVPLQGRGQVIGIASDLTGRVWVSHFRTADEGGGAISAIDTTVTPMRALRPIRLVDHTGRVAERPMGVGIDSNERVWAITRNDSCVDENGDATGCAVRYDPVDGEVTMHPVGKGPYTYSDFLGFVARNFSARRGFYRQRVDICARPVGHWGELDLDAETPEGSAIFFRVRATLDEAELPQARFTSWRLWEGMPVSLEPLLAAVGEEQGFHLEIELRFELGLGEPVPGALCPPQSDPPRFRGLAVFADCETELQ